MIMALHQSPAHTQSSLLVVCLVSRSTNDSVRINYKTSFDFIWWRVKWAFPWINWIFSRYANYPWLLAECFKSICRSFPVLSCLVLSATRTHLDSIPIHHVSLQYFLFYRGKLCWLHDNMSMRIVDVLHLLLRIQSGNGMALVQPINTVRRSRNERRIKGNCVSSVTNLQIAECLGPLMPVPW